MKRFVFISNMAAPYQVKLCYALQPYFDAEFWFHVHVEPDRPSWWRVPLGDRCRILEGVLFRDTRRYLALGLYRELRRFDPEILLLGGFTVPTTAVAYLWAKRHGRKVGVFSEIRRDRQGNPRPRSWFSTCLRRFYSGLDFVLTPTEEATRLFRDEYGFSNVVTGQYPADLDAYFEHPARPRGPQMTYLFPNRLVDMYDPLLALDVFANLARRHEDAVLLLNGSGPLRQDCERRISASGLSGRARFLDGIRSWDELPRVYRDADVLLLPARHSAGNFTIMEGMASGMGIVISDRIQGIGKQIVDGVNGFVRSPDANAFVEAVQRYHEQPSLFVRHASVNRVIAGRLTAGATARRYHELLGDLP